VPIDTSCRSPYCTLAGSTTLEPLTNENPREEAMEQPQPQPAFVDMLPLQADEQLPANLPLIPATELVDDGTNATMHRSNCTKHPS